MKAKIPECPITKKEAETIAREVMGDYVEEAMSAIACLADDFDSPHLDNAEKSLELARDAIERFIEQIKRQA